MLQNGGTTTGDAAGATIGGAGDGLIKDATTATFMTDVIEESRKQPVLVDFWAPWCGPCKQLTPGIEKAVRAAKGKVKLAKMDIDKNPEIPGQMGIQSIPAVIAFVNGQPADGFLGALPEGQVVAFLERLTKEKLGGGDEGADLLKNAEAALAQGDATTAAEIYAAVLATMAATAATQGPRVAIGAALLVCSDTLIGMRIAGVPPLPGPPVWVMATYLLGQALIVTGWPEEAKTSTADYAKVAA